MTIEKTYTVIKLDYRNRLLNVKPLLQKWQTHREHWAVKEHTPLSKKRIEFEASVLVIVVIDVIANNKNWTVVDTDKECTKKAQTIYKKTVLLSAFYV